MSRSIEEQNSDLLVCCNFLNRVETLLDANTRSQIPRDNIELITKCLTRVIDYSVKGVKEIESQLMVFGSCISAIDEVTMDESFSETNEDLKKLLVDRLSPAIVEFKVNVGKYLTNRKFRYIPSQDRVIQNIIDVSINNGYYFEY